MIALFYALCIFWPNVWWQILLEIYCVLSQVWIHVVTGLLHLRVQFFWPKAPHIFISSSLGKFWMEISHIHEQFFSINFLQVILIYFSRLGFNVTFAGDTSYVGMPNLTNSVHLCFAFFIHGILIGWRYWLSNMMLCYDKNDAVLMNKHAHKM